MTTLLDFVTSYALIVNDGPEFRSSVSISLSNNFFSPILLNSEIFILTKTEKIGKKIGSSSIEVFDQERKLLANGSHLVAFIPPIPMKDGKTISELFSSN